jgi:hypothetical protein
MRLFFNTALTTATLLLGVAVLHSAAVGDAHWVRFWAVLVALIGVVSAVRVLDENRVSDA